MGESSQGNHVNFSCIDVAISVDDSLSQEGHAGSSGQALETSCLACRTCKSHGVGSCLMPERSRAQRWRLGHEPQHFTAATKKEASCRT